MRFSIISNFGGGDERCLLYIFYCCPKGKKQKVRRQDRLVSCEEPVHKKVSSRGFILRTFLLCIFLSLKVSSPFEIIEIKTVRTFNNTFFCLRLKSSTALLFFRGLIGFLVWTPKRKVHTYIFDEKYSFMY